jgi:hypothetical protein
LEWNRADDGGVAQLWQTISILGAHTQASAQDGFVFPSELGEAGSRFQNGCSFILEAPSTPSVSLVATHLMLPSADDVQGLAATLSYTILWRFYNGTIPA